MSCPRCDKRMRPRKSPKNRYSLLFKGQMFLKVTKQGKEIADVIAVQVPDRAWRVRYAADGKPQLCRCRNGVETYVDTHGPFAVHLSRALEPHVASLTLRGRNLRRIVFDEVKRFNVV